MSENPNRAEIARRVEKAEKLLQKGKTADALAEYLLILESDPPNDNVRQMAADLCLSLNKGPQAVRLMGELFERQVAAADATRASLTYKKLARYTNPTWEQKVRFGQLLEQSNKKLAVGTYENALEDLNKQGRKEEALLVLQRIVSLEPSQPNHLRIAEVSAQLGEHVMASQSFLQLAEMTEAAGANASQWFERAYTENPSDAKIALAYGKSLLTRGEAGAAIFIFEPLVHAGDASLELKDLYAQALLSADRCLESEPLIWALFEQNPARIHQVVGLIGKMIDSELDAEAVALARKLEAFQRRRGERRSFITTMQELLASHRPSADMLEFLAELFNASNRETDYAQALLKLFDLYCAKHDYQKAGECLDRAAEVDPYETGHQKRLETLRGKIDDQRFNVIASRFSATVKKEEHAVKAPEPTLGPAALQDLMLQAEILVQYGMRSKAIERLQRIQELFPREEERNPDLQKLYMAAGIERQYAKAPGVPAPVAASAAPSADAPTPPVAATAASETADVSSLARVAEITRKLYHQGNAEGVLKTTANEIGSNWRTARCIVALRKPGLPPSSIQEYHMEGLIPASSAALVTLIETVQDLAVARGTVTVNDAKNSPELMGVRNSVEELQIESLLALPLTEGNDTNKEQIGVLVLTQNMGRIWQAAEVLVIRTLSDQVLIALNNAGLRRLVKNLSVTDEKSGLLKRASYLDLLQAETRRGLQQGTTVTVLLMQFGRRSALIKEYGEQSVTAVMEQIGQLFSANIRTNDLAFRYEATTVALVLGDTGEKEALLAVEKLRRLLTEVRFPGKDKPVEFSAGLAQAVMRQHFDPVDIVTEVANRADHALELAVAQGAGKIVSQAPQFAASAAVA
ncbi:MAG TPA: diguanylate cyclase [Terriglobales bacterium]|jgi:diguanylate cyclase (GGDEF)-like protein|nr:diguanylate cyclase [Terriglobales bacterium]